jgi:hypothetical protein
MACLLCPGKSHPSGAQSLNQAIKKLTATNSGASLKAGADKYNLTEENAYPEQYVLLHLFAERLLMHIDTHVGHSIRDKQTGLALYITENFIPFKQTQLNG